ncbi:MAG: glycosyltransferase [Bowdeniella nasicola]|nr:glycosyltransferase [Bowdeniella nasicola]
MPSTQAVTVIIPHYGDPVPTGELARALLNDRGHHCARVLIVDDASPHPALDPEPGNPDVSVLRRETNGGFGAAVNTGLRATTTDLALVLNSDAYLSGTQIDDLVEVATPFQPAVAGPAVVGPDGTSQWSARTFPTIAAQVIEWLTPLARFRQRRWWHRAVNHDVHAAAATEAVAVDWVTGVAMLLPVAEVMAVGGFDESFFMNSEETDLQYRLRERGVARLYVPSVRVVHEGGASSDPGLRRSWLVASRYRYAEKHGHPRALSFALTAASLVNAGVNVARQLAGRDVNAREVLAYELSLLRARPPRVDHD